MKATESGAVTIRAAVERSGMESSMIDRTYMGCVLLPALGRLRPAKRRLALDCPSRWGRRKSMLRQI